MQIFVTEAVFTWHILVKSIQNSFIDSDGVLIDWSEVLIGAMLVEGGGGGGEQGKGKRWGGGAKWKELGAK